MTKNSDESYVPKRGDIVYARIFDPEGKNPVRRRAIVASEPDGSGIVSLVAITRKFDPDNPDPRHILMAWSKEGHRMTSLTDPCVAKCEWRVNKPISEVTKAGRAHGSEVFQMNEIIANLDRH